jgi:LuxR family maltose regulon positive regulatory protein
MPFLSVQTLLELARTYLALADPAGARVVLRESRDILRHRPDLGTLPHETDELRSRLDTLQAGSVGASSLTTAELRLVPLLSTHLSFREIGERLHVSRYTVKTQAISVYRKLGVTSRSEAIERALAIGLLGRLVTAVRRGWHQAGFTRGSSSRVPPSRRPRRARRRHRRSPA